MSMTQGDLFGHVDVLKHTCHAHGCSNIVPPRMFVCRTHWRQLSQELQKAIWREYKNGQERTKDPSLRYMSVQQYAIGKLAFKPNDERAAADAAPYLIRAMRFRVAAYRNGEGDPLDGLTEVALSDCPNLD